MVTMWYSIWHTMWERGGGGVRGSIVIAEECELCLSPHVV